MDYSKDGKIYKFKNASEESDAAELENLYNQYKSVDFLNLLYDNNIYILNEEFIYNVDVIWDEYIWKVMNDYELGLLERKEFDKYIIDNPQRSIKIFERILKTKEPDNNDDIVIYIKKMLKQIGKSDDIGDTKTIYKLFEDAYKKSDYPEIKRLFKIYILGYKYSNKILDLLYSNHINLINNNGYELLSEALYNNDINVLNSKEFKNYIMKNISKSIDIFNNYILSLKNTKSEFRTFVEKILDNLNNKNKFEDVKFIEGPMSLTEYQRIDEKTGERIHIYVFGDEHVHNSKCPGSTHIVQFLKELFNKSDKKIDFYLETQYITNKKYINYNNHISDNYLFDLEVFFNECFNTKICPYINIRFHYSDIRNPFNETEFSRIFMTFYHMIKGKQQLTQEFIDTDIVTIIKQSHVVSKIYKQIDNVNNNDKKIINDHFKPLVDSSLLMINIYKNNVDVKETNDFLNNKIFIEFCFYFFLYLMDYYLISRLMRSYTKNGRIDNDSKSKNVIIYVGDYHAQNYQVILKKLGFNMINKQRQKSHFYKHGSDDGTYQCINLKGFKLPFFS